MQVEVKSEITGMVWKVLVQVGTRVVEGEPLMILESMKMEIPLLSPTDGVVQEIRMPEGSAIAERDVAVVLGE